MHTDLQSFFTLFTLIVSLFLPKLISYVATHNKHWVNFVISYGSSIVLGVVTAWAGGKFSSDIWMNVTIAITAAQASYQSYWKPKKEAETIAVPVNVPVDPDQPSAL